MEDFDIIALVYDCLECLDVPIIEGWYDAELNKTHITVHEYLEQDESFEDDEAREEEHNIQIDVWSKDSLEAFKLKKSIKKLLKKNNFYFDSSDDFYETKTRIYHKGLRFSYISEIS